MNRGRKVAGRGLAQLAEDFGYQLPASLVSEPAAKAASVFTSIARRRGRMGQMLGWTAVPLSLPTYRMTSDEVGGVWPFITASGLAPTGAMMGLDYLSGGAFYADPLGWVLDPDMPVTNGNVMIFGKPGQGKSGTVKTFCLRMMPYGYRVLILGDPKDEYEKLCRALGVEPIVFGHGQWARINVLDYGPLRHGWQSLSRQEQVTRTQTTFARWLRLIAGLVGSQKIGNEHVPFGPNEGAVITEVLSHLTGRNSGNSDLRETTIPQVWHALNNPTDELIAAGRHRDRHQFFDRTELLRNTLATLVYGHLAGLFDAPTNVEIDWRAPIQSLSLSRISPLGDEAIGIALMCLNSWGTGMRAIAEPGDLRIVVRDEAWRQMRLGVEAVKALDADLRLSRGGTGAGADVQIVAAHKPSDLLSVGSAGSQEVAIARDMMHLCDTKILLGQDEEVGAELGSSLGLPAMGQDIVTRWAMARTGRALWMVGTRLFKVASILTRTERDLTWTNDALAKA
ncbi:MAG: ATP-binding protein [Jatrophihabitantaceae bacterium]